MKAPLILFLFALFAGAWFGWRSAPTPAVETPAPMPRGTPQPERRWTPEDFHSRALEVVRRYQQPDHNPIADLLADWTDGEIRAALHEALRDPEYVLEGGSGGDVMAELLAEWMRRDLEAAIAWFDQIEIETAQRRMALRLSYRWPREHAERGLEFVLAHRDIFAGGSPWSILAKNFEASASSGPQALGILLEKISAEGLSLDFGNSATLPDGFDYSAFVETDGFLKTMETPAVSALLAGWMIQDREAAFDWLLENRGAKGLVNMMQGERGAQLDNWEWLGAKVGSMDEEKRQELLDALESRRRSDYPAAARFAAGIEDPVLREHVHGIGARAILRGAVGPAIQSLEQIGDPAKRVEILSAMKRSDDPMAATFRQPISDADAALLRTKLAEWQADETEIDEIFQNLKP